VTCLALLALLSPSIAQDLPVEAGALLAARAFALQEARPYAWMQGHPPIREGLLLALAVDPDLARPRQIAEPVLYVGGVPAERLNAGYPSGRLLVLIPGTPDLAALPVWFGDPELPERIDADDGAAALAGARALGVAPFSPAEVERALAAGGAALRLRDGRALDHAVASWIEAWAPAEAERAENLRAPAP